MTAQLPHNLLQLFAPRPPLRYLPANDYAPEDRRTKHIDGVAQYLPQLKEEFGDYKPTESWLEKKDREKLEKDAQQKWHLDEGFKQLFNPSEDTNVRGDPYKTLFISRLSYDTETKDIERENTGDADPKKKGKPRGYAFVVFDRERDMKGKPPHFY
jgi:U1 small nuclear ribonucleoprotein